MGVSYAFEANAAEAANSYQRAFDRQVQAGALESAGGIANAIGRVYLETGDNANAEKWYRTGYESANKVPGRTPAQTDLTEMRWHHAQARIAARRKQFDIARKHVEEVRAIVERGQLGASQRVNHPHVAGYVAFYQGHTDSAIAELLKADQDDPFILSLLAQAYRAEKGSGEGARAVREDPVAVHARCRWRLGSRATRPADGVCPSARRAAAGRHAVALRRLGVSSIAAAPGGHPGGLFTATTACATHAPGPLISIVAGGMDSTRGGVETVSE